jgi:hypothetical protein
MGYATMPTSCFSASSSKAMTCSLVTVGNLSKKLSIDSPALR